MKYLIYLWYVLRHKWFVGIACLKEGQYLHAITHDLSKFRLSEFSPYVNYFYGDIKKGRDKTGYYKPTDTGDRAFDFAWLLHQKRNRHHWQWWILPEDEGGIKVLPMPHHYLIQMLCDWQGAGKEQKATTTVNQWYYKNKSKMQFNEITQMVLEKMLEKQKWNKRRDVTTKFNAQDKQRQVQNAP